MAHIMVKGKCPLAVDRYFNDRHWIHAVTYKVAIFYVRELFCGWNKFKGTDDVISISKHNNTNFAAEL